MLNRTRKHAVLFAIAASALMVWLAGTANAGQAARRHSLTITTTFRALYAPSAKFDATGVISGNPLGRGATVRHVAVQPSGQLSVRFTLFTKRGSVSGETTETRTPQSDGSVSFDVVSGTITGGTGAYAGARGHFAGSGSEPSSQSPVTESLHGSIKY